MKKGDKVVYKKKVVERLSRSGNNTQTNVEMEIHEIRKDVVVVRSGGCLIRVNPNAIEVV